MNFSKLFTIPFSQLCEGKHFYEYEIDDSFFEQFQYSEIGKSDIHISLTLEEEFTMLVLVFFLEGTINVMCDRCSDYFDMMVKGQNRLIVKFGDEIHEETDEIIVIPSTTHELEITHYIYEYINLLLPQSRIHPQGQCNKEIILKLEELSEVNNSGNNIDPRWEALRNVELEIKN